jgi:hypothetical protein
MLLILHPYSMLQNIMTGLSVLQSLAGKSPELLDFHEDLVSLEAASKVLCTLTNLDNLHRYYLLYFLKLFKQLQLKALAEEQQAVVKGLEKVEQELTASESDGPVSDAFRKVHFPTFSGVLSPSDFIHVLFSILAVMPSSR